MKLTAMPCRLKPSSQQMATHASQQIITSRIVVASATVPWSCRIKW